MWCITVLCVCTALTEQKISMTWLQSALSQVVWHITAQLAISAPWRLLCSLTMQYKVCHGDYAEIQSLTIAHHIFIELSRIFERVCSKSFAQMLMWICQKMQFIQGYIIQDHENSIMDCIHWWPTIASRPGSCLDFTDFMYFLILGNCPHNSWYFGRKCPECAKCCVLLSKNCLTYINYCSDASIQFYLYTLGDFIFPLKLWNVTEHCGML